MPNGGSDCCFTCCFNEINEGKTGFPKPPVKLNEIAYCIIRDQDIEDPFYTYCVNHPYHSPEKISIPIGAIYIGNSEAQRDFWKPSPDTEKIRHKLIQFLEAIPEKPRREYRFGLTFDEEVITQLMRFKERRAISGLQRVLAFNPFLMENNNDPHSRSRISTIAKAVEALIVIDLEEVFPEIEKYLTMGLDEIKFGKNAEKGKDPLAMIRYHAVRGLAYCYSSHAGELLKKALNDPNEKIATLANKILEGESLPFNKYFT